MTTQTLTIAGIVIVMALACAVVIAEIVTGRTIPDATNLLGFAGVIVSVLATFLGIRAKVQDVHLQINSRMDQLIGTTASDSFQKGQTAGPNGDKVP